MDGFINAIKLHAAGMDAQQGRARVGVVTSVNPSDHTVRVTYQPENVLSGWLPALAWRGGVGAPPMQGDQVLVEAQEGDGEHGVVVGVIYSDANRPPVFNDAPAQAGEFLYVNPVSGAVVYLNNGGTITLQDPGGTQIELTNDGTIAVTGTLAVTGALDLTGNLQMTGTLAVTGAIVLNGTIMVAP